MTPSRRAFLAFFNNMQCHVMQEDFEVDNVGNCDKRTHEELKSLISFYEKNPV